MGDLTTEKYTTREIMFTRADGEIFTADELRSMKTKSKSTKEIYGTVRVGLFKEGVDLRFGLIGYFDAWGYIIGDDIVWLTPEDVEYRSVRDVHHI